MIYYIAYCLWARGRGVIIIKVCILYFGDGTIFLKVCGGFSLINLEVSTIYKEMILLINPCSGYVLLYI